MHFYESPPSIVGYIGHNLRGRERQNMAVSDSISVFSHAQQRHRRYGAYGYEPITDGVKRIALCTRMNAVNVLAFMLKREVTELR